MFIGKLENSKDIKEEKEKLSKDLVLLLDHDI